MDDCSSLSLAAVGISKVLFLNWQWWLWKFSFQVLLILVQNRLASARQFCVRIPQIVSLSISCAMDAEIVLMEVMRTTVWLCAKIRVCEFTKHYSCILVGALELWGFFSTFRWLFVRWWEDVHSERECLRWSFSLSWWLRWEAVSRRSW